MCGLPRRYIVFEKHFQSFQYKIFFSFKLQKEEAWFNGKKWNKLINNEN
jgi:hypothetical protein